MPYRYHQYHGIANLSANPNPNAMDGCPCMDPLSLGSLGPLDAIKFNNDQRRVSWHLIFASRMKKSLFLFNVCVKFSMLTSLESMYICTSLTEYFGPVSVPDSSCEGINRSIGTLCLLILHVFCMVYFSNVFYVFHWILYLCLESGTSDILFSENHFWVKVLPIEQMIILALGSCL